MTRIKHNNDFVETSFELIVTEYGLTNTGGNSPISIEVTNIALFLIFFELFFMIFLQEGDSFSIIFKVVGFQLTNNTRQTYPSPPDSLPLS